MLACLAANVRHRVRQILESNASVLRPNASISTPAFWAIPSSRFAIGVRFGYATW